MSTPADTTPASSHPTTGQDTSAGQDTRTSFREPRQLCRPIHDRMLGGVAAGIADFLGLDETLVRIAFVVATFVGGVAIPVYLAGWLLIPEEGCDHSLASDIIQSVSQSLSARSN